MSMRAASTTMSCASSSTACVRSVRMRPKCSMGMPRNLAARRMRQSIIPRNASGAAFSVV